MEEYLNSIEFCRNILGEKNYRILVSKIVLHYLKGTEKNRQDLLHKVNRVLSKQNIKPISYGFIRINEN